MNTVGSNLLKPTDDEDYWNNDPRFANTLSTVTVKTPVKKTVAETHSNMWLWLTAGAAALFFFGKKLK